LWVEVDVSDGRPVARCTRPAIRSLVSRLLVDEYSLREDRDVKSVVALGGRDEADAAVTMFLVVPTDEALDPRPRLVEGSERLRWELRAIFERAKERLGKPDPAYLLRGASGKAPTGRRRPLFRAT